MYENLLNLFWDSIYQKNHILPNFHMNIHIFMKFEKRKKYQKLQCLIINWQHIIRI